MAITEIQRKKMEKEHFEYVVEEVMDEDKGSNLTKALTYNKCNAFTDLMRYSSQKNEALSFRYTKGN